MTALEKVSFLKKSYNLSDRSFCSRFHIKLGNYKKWVAGKITPDSDSLSYLCKELELDLDDFMSDSSSLTKDGLKDTEHLCKAAKKNDNHDSVISEDFPIEDNSRYEEKD